MKTGLLTLSFIIFSSYYHAQIKPSPKVESGVSYELAQFRKSTLSNIKYELDSIFLKVKPTEFRERKI